MRGLEEQLYVQMMTGRAGGLFGGVNWLELAMFLALLALVVFRPERIQSTALFRWACTLFALSVCLPPLVSLLIGALFAPLQSSAFGASGPGAPAGLMLLTPSVMQPLFFGCSLFCLFAAVIPIRNRPPQTASPAPPKHPLD